VFSLIVVTIILLTLAETGIETEVGYRYLVSNWGNNCILAGLPKPILFQPPIIAISTPPSYSLISNVIYLMCVYATVGTMVDAFYIWRIWAFGRSFGSPGRRYLLGSICIFVVVVRASLLITQIPFPDCSGSIYQLTLLSVACAIAIPVLVSSMNLNQTEKPQAEAGATSVPPNRPEPRAYFKVTNNRRLVDHICCASRHSDNGAYDNYRAYRQRLDW
jgi:hypothetical protein